MATELASDLKDGSPATSYGARRSISQLPSARR